MKNEPSENALIVALKENWLHARSQEQSRIWHLNFYMLMLAGILAIAFRERLPLHHVLVNYWPLFGFLYVLAIYVLLDIAKLNLEFSNHIRAVQWISEKLNLDKELSEEREKLIERFLAEGKLSEEEKGDVMYQGYMALPLPVPVSVYKVFQNLMYLLIIGTAWASISGFILQFNIFSFLTYFQSPILLPMSQIRLSAYLTGAFFGLVSCLFCRASVKRISYKAKKLLDLREPDGIKLRYRAEPYFYE